MTASDDIASSVEAFARLCAAVGDPFVAPAGILARANVDAPTFARIAEAWMNRFWQEGEAGRQLHERFVAVYHETRGAPPVAPAPSSSVLADSTEEAPGHATEPVDTRALFRRVLPFDAAARASSARPPPAAPPPALNDPASETALLPTTGTLRRLVRFDPQTGRPLARPFWQDIVRAETPPR